MAFWEQDQVVKPAPGAKPPPVAQPQGENPIMGALHGFENAMGAPDPAQDMKKSFGEQMLDFFGRALTTAPWVLGGSMKGVPGAGPRPPDLGVLKMGQGAVEDALRPQGPWGPRQEPPNPQPSPVPRTGGPTPETLASGDQAAAQQAYDASLTKAVGTAANRSVAGYNMNAAKNDPAAIASRAGQRAVEGAMSNLEQPPPQPFRLSPGAEPGANMIPVRVPSSVSAQELRAFLQEQGVPEAKIQAQLADHANFVGSNPVQPEPPPPGPKAPAPSQAMAEPPAPSPPVPRAPAGAAKPVKAEPLAPSNGVSELRARLRRVQALKKALPSEPAPSPPAPRAVVGETAKPIEQRAIEIPADPGAKQWLRKAAGILRSAHDIRQILTGNPVKIARTTMQWFIRNYPEVEKRDPETLNKIAADVLRRLSGGK